MHDSQAPKNAEILNHSVGVLSVSRNEKRSEFAEEKKKVRRNSVPNHSELHNFVPDYSAEDKVEY
jgi:hypothetical protein